MKPLSREEIQRKLADWLDGWNTHDLEKVMDLIHDDILFENWTGVRIGGKKRLQKVWTSWFENNGGFRFFRKDLFIDEVEQKVLFEWLLEWPSVEKGHRGEKEKRSGVDILRFKDGKIIEKSTYSKTVVEIAGKRVALTAPAGL